METQSDYWNRVASHCRFTHELDLSTFSNRVSNTSRVLDIGCGYGRLLEELRIHGYLNTLGIDTSNEMIERGQRLHPELDLKHFDNLPLPVQDGSVAACLVFAVLTCIPNNADQLALVDEVRRVLAPNGTVWVSDYWIQEDERNKGRYEQAQILGSQYGVFQLPDGVWLRHHRREWISQLFSGFGDITIVDTSFQTMNGNTASGFRLVAQKV